MTQPKKDREPMFNTSETANRAPFKDTQGKTVAPVGSKGLGKQSVNAASPVSGAADLSLERYMLEPLAPALATVDGWPINMPNMASTVSAIVAAAKRGEGFTVFTLNLDHLVKLRSLAPFRMAYRSARFVTADGEPVARLAARQDSRIERTTGADLVIPLSKAAAGNGLPVFLFGSTPDTLARAGLDLAERSGGDLDIAGTLAPSQDFDPEGPEADAALERIAQSGARLCYVALGAPKQEVFAAYAQRRGVNVGFVCIGAALDFLSGQQIRAPETMQKLGLEWLWRLSTSPRRLAKRYMMCALVLADITIMSPIRHAMSGVRS